MKHHHTLANAELANAFADFRNDPRSFVAKNTRRGVGAGSDLLKIGSANSASVDSNQNFSVPDFGDRHFLQTHVVHAAIDGGLHRGRDFEPFACNR